MGNMFGGKLTGGIFAVIGAIIGIIMVGIMAGPFGTLGAYFEPAAQGTDSQRFSRLYTQVTGDTEPSETDINTDTNRAGGRGYALTGATGAAPSITVVAADAGKTFYNEQGENVGTLVTSSRGSTACSEAGVCYLGSSYTWRNPPEAYSRLNFLNGILVSILALVAAIGLLWKTKMAYDAFSQGGVKDLTPVVIKEVTTMVLGIVGIYLAPTMLNVLAGTAQVYTSGQYDFSFVSQILGIVFAIVPTMIIVGIMGLVSGIQVASFAGKVTKSPRTRGFGRRRALGGMVYQ